MLVALCVAALVLSALALYFACYTFWVVRGTIESAAEIIRMGPFGNEASARMQAPTPLAAQPAYARVHNPDGPSGHAFHGHGHHPRPPESTL